MADFVYVDFGIVDKEIDFARPDSGPIAGSYAADLSGTIFTLAGGRTLVRNESYSMDGVVGWRRVGLTLGLAGDLFSGEAFDFEKDLDLNDAFIGVNGRYAFGNGDRWTLRYYADIGTGESDMTWQALLGLAYGFRWGDLFVAYRHLDYDIGDVSGLNDLTISLSGPTFGATFRFGASD
jgi:hypothetical protein